MEGGYTSLWKMSTIMVAWLRKIASWDRLQYLEIRLTFIGEGDISFHYKSGSFKELPTSLMYVGCFGFGV